jgi:SRSO17 transposase
MTDLRTLAAIIKARWTCGQAHQQMKEELGLDHFEGDPGKLFKPDEPDALFKLANPMSEMF